MVEAINMRQPNARGARLTVIGQDGLRDLIAMIEAHWRHNVGTATKEQLAEWQSWIDELSALLV
jgi:hypothetical protein